MTFGKKKRTYDDGDCVGLELCHTIERNLKVVRDIFGIIHLTCEMVWPQQELYVN